MGVACGLLLFWLCDILAEDVKALVRKEVARAVLVMGPPVETNKEKKQ